MREDVIEDCASGRSHRWRREEHLSKEKEAAGERGTRDPDGATQACGRILGKMWLMVSRRTKAKKKWNLITSQVSNWVIKAQD